MIFNAFSLPTLSGTFVIPLLGGGDLDWCLESKVSVCRGDHQIRYREIHVGTPIKIDVPLAKSDKEKKALKKDGGGIYNVEFNIPGVVLSNSDF